MTALLVDCRPRDDYLAGHSPGAVHLDPEDDLTGEIINLLTYAVRHALRPRGHLRARERDRRRARSHGSRL